MSVTPVSVIVRSRNEAEHLGAVLAAVRAQRWAAPVEIVCVDNRSTDGSREIALEQADRCLDIERYRPGAALNLAIEASRGDLIVVLSGHAIPASTEWLSALLAQHGEERLAGVYGSQRYCDHARFLDKKDLDLFRYGPPRREVKDTDFWNANSSFQRATWRIQAFDGQVFELEDHYWTKCLTPMGYHVRYEPAAAVYHYGHYGRNDRTLPGCPDDDETLAAAVEALAVTDPSWPERMDAVLRIKTLAHRIEDDGVVARLRELLRDDEDFDVRWRAADALSRFPSEDVAASLAAALDDPSYYVRDEAAWSLARLGALGIDAATRRLDDLPGERRHLVALVLAASGTEQGEARSIELLTDELNDTENPLDAIYVAGELLGRRPADVLRTTVSIYLGHGEAAIARTACWALGRLGPDRRESLVGRVSALALEHASPDVRGEATTALTRCLHGVSAAVAWDVVGRAAADPVGAVRFCAVHGLRRFVDDGGEAPTVLGDLDDDDFGVRFEAALLCGTGSAAVSPPPSRR